MVTVVTVIFMRFRDTHLPEQSSPFAVQASPHVTFSSPACHYGKLCPVLPVTRAHMEMEAQHRHSYSRATTHECVQRHGALIVKNWTGIGSEEKQEQTELLRGLSEQKKTKSHWSQRPPSISPPLICGMSSQLNLYVALVHLYSHFAELCCVLELLRLQQSQISAC